MKLYFEHTKKRRNTIEKAVFRRYRRIYIESRLRKNGAPDIFWEEPNISDKLYLAAINGIHAGNDRLKTIHHPQNRHGYHIRRELREKAEKAAKQKMRVMQAIRKMPKASEVIRRYGASISTKPIPNGEMKNLVLLQPDETKRFSFSLPESFVIRRIRFERYERDLSESEMSLYVIKQIRVNGLDLMTRPVSILLLKSLTEDETHTKARLVGAKFIEFDIYRIPDEHTAMRAAFWLVIS